MLQPPIVPKVEKTFGASGVVGAVMAAPRPPGYQLGIFRI